MLYRLPKISLQPSSTPDKYLLARFRWAGVHYKRNTGTTSSRKALRLAKALLRQVMEQTPTHEPERVPVPSLSFKAESERFLHQEYISRFRKPRTLEKVRLCLKRLALLMPSDELSQIDRAGYDAIAQAIRAEDPSPKYWCDLLCLHKKFFRWLLEDGKISADPTKGWKLPPKETFGKGETVWKEEEYETFISHCPKGDREIYEVLYHTGMSPADIFNLKRKHLVCPQGEWRIVKLREKAKSSLETINQPISSKVLPVILSRLKTTKDPEENLFPSTAKDQFAWVRKFTDRRLHLWRKLFPGTPPKDLKAFRHTFASRWAEKDVPLDVLRAWCGHTPSSRTLEAVYIHRTSTARYME
jgi:integrase